ncbi:MAG: PIG-L family deacetylase [Cyclobacteriaceae bacterium]|nr:PIG-L family deacetylase [Cyclobacteriaceae bacterium]
MQQKLKKLNVLGTVLYVAAHPDDENTRLITHMANEEMVETGYFSFTRGDGGQNLIGPEIRDELGVIRTQELLEARKIDHGKQFFSRAVDFGYSKHPDETFGIWDREKVLGDLVWIIRRFRPDVIITRFNTEYGTTHGHHTASAILAQEAFDLAADATKYSEQLKYVDTWQANALYWNTYFWVRSEYQKDTADLLKIDVGGFNPLLGMSYTEIAALSRSSHKSQGFGATGTRGEQLEFLQFEKGREAIDDVFDHVDLTWGRLPNAGDITAQISGILSKFNPTHPVGILDDLVALRKRINKLNDEFWKARKLREVDELIYAITGLFLEVKAENTTAFPGETISLAIEAINRSEAPSILKQIHFDLPKEKSTIGLPLGNNELMEMTSTITIPADAPYAQPYWLTQKHDLGMFDVDNQLLIGKGENDPAISAEFVLEIAGESISFSRPVVYKENDPVRGEVYHPFYIAPPVYVNVSSKVILFADESAREVSVVVRAGKDQANGIVSLSLPDTWVVEPASQEFSLARKGESKTFVFEVKPPEGEETVLAKAVARMDGISYSNSYTRISYDHIPEQMLFGDDEVKFVKLNLKKGNEKIGYIMGAGDNIPDNLSEIGYEVSIINTLDFDEPTLDQFDVIILGIRALNTVDRLKFDMAKLLAFVYRGGNLIVQYNTSHALVTENFAPYPLTLSRDRVTVEDAEVILLNPWHPLMNFPNKIGKQDFEGWEQERGLYFPGSWSAEYQALLSSHDPGENALKGGLLVAGYGEGTFIYTGYSWFRALPAGVPGAYRIFANLISSGKQTR